MKSFNASTCGLALALIASLTAAQPASAQSLASINLDWTSLSATSTNGSFAWLGNQGGNFLENLSAAPGGLGTPVSQSFVNWATTPISVSSGAVTTTDSSTLGSGTIGSGFAGSAYAQSVADLARLQEFTLAAGDTATIALNYSTAFAAGYGTDFSWNLSMTGQDLYGSTSPPVAQVYGLSSGLGDAGSGSLVFSYTNTNTSLATIAFTIDGTVYAIPEPSSQALMLGGLLAILLAAYRRRHRPA